MAKLSRLHIAGNALGPFSGRCDSSHVARALAAGWAGQERPFLFGNRGMGCVPQGKLVRSKA